LGLLFVVLFLRERDTTALVVRLGISLVGVVLWGLLLGRAYRSAGTKQFGTYKLLQEPARYRFTAGGVSTATASSQGSVAWSVYYRTIETKQAFYLYQGGRGGTDHPQAVLRQRRADGAVPRSPSEQPAARGLQALASRTMPERLAAVLSHGGDVGRKLRRRSQPIPRSDLVKRAAGWKPALRMLASAPSWRSMT
jgi:hypothetical protein